MSPRRISEQYVLDEKLAEGGQAVVYLGRIRGAEGFTRTVAIKRPTESALSDPETRAMFIDEARLAARIQHPHVTATLDVVEDGGDLYIVMEYVAGRPLSDLASRVAVDGTPCEPAIAARIASDVLRGLHAAHEATDDRGVALDLVHRDVSPANVVVGLDGAARLLDFGIAKAAVREAKTETGVLKGKIAYMAPEQLRAGSVDRRVDVYAAGVVLWEMLAGRRLHTGTQQAVWLKVLNERPPAVTALVSTVPSELAAVVARAVAKSPGERYATALAMAVAIDGAIDVATHAEVGSWVERIAGATLAAEAEAVAALARAPFPPMAVTAVPSPRPRLEARLRRTTLGIAALGVLVVAVGAAIAIRRPPEVRAAAASAEEESASAAAPPVLASPPSTPADPSAEVAAGPSSGASPRRPPPVRRARSARPAACDTPFVVDANGHKVFREECLR